MNNPFFDPHNQSNDIYDSGLNDRENNQTPSRQTTQTLRKFIIILLTIGLTIGIISSWVIVKMMNKYGLTEKTNQIEQLQQQK